MSRLQSNIDELRKMIGGDEEMIEFLDAIEQGVDDLNDNAKELEDEVNDKDSEIRDLESKIEAIEDREFGEMIKTPSGSITFETDGSIHMEWIMEALRERIERYGEVACLERLKMRVPV